MQSRMHPKYYLSQEIFDREQAKVFRKVWLFAGLAAMVSENNSYLTRKIAGVPVVIQNFKGEIKAFENVCLHRSAPLQQGFCGRRALVCPYHAWSYDSSGAVKQIPDCNALYRFNDGERQSLKLREFALKQIGSLLFINLSSDPMLLEDQFSSKFITLLEDSSNHYDTEVTFTTWHASFNWKLVYENLRDLNHVRYIHPKSLGQALKFQKHESDIFIDEAASPLTNLSPAGLRTEMRRFSQAGAEDAEYVQARHEAWMDMVEPWRGANGYYNWLAYPNLHIASGTGGYSFSIENHVPVSPGKTDVEIYYFTAKKKQRYATSHQVLLSHMHYSKKVVGEDIAILEAVQSALHHDAPMPTQGAYETQNRLVERWYTTLMETSHEI